MLTCYHNDLKQTQMGETDINSKWYKLEGKGKNSSLLFIDEVKDSFMQLLTPGILLICSKEGPFPATKV